MSHIPFSKMVELMMEGIKHSDFSGFDVEVKVSYEADEEGVDHLYVDGSPTVKFSVVKHRDGVKMQPYYFNGDDEEEIG